MLDVPFLINYKIINRIIKSSYVLLQYTWVYSVPLQVRCNRGDYQHNVNQNNVVLQK